MIAGSSTKVQIETDGRVYLFQHGIITAYTIHHSSFGPVETEIVIRGYQENMSYNAHVSSHIPSTERLVTDHVWACEYCGKVNLVYDHSCKGCGANPPLVPDVLKRLRVPAVRQLLGLR